MVSPIVNTGHQAASPKIKKDTTMLIHERSYALLLIALSPATLLEDLLLVLLITKNTLPVKNGLICHLPMLIKTICLEKTL
jgi:hypothetical protein